MDLVIGIVGSLIAAAIGGASVWGVQRVRLRRDRLRRGLFLGLSDTARVVIVLNHSPRAGPNPAAASARLMTHLDLAVVFELGTLVKGLGIDPVLREAGELIDDGDLTEFVVGGPISNPRADEILRSRLPGTTFAARSSEADQAPRDVIVGGVRYPCVRGVAEYAVVARFRDGRGCSFVIAGQTGLANLAAARLLRRRLDEPSPHWPLTADFARLVVLRNSTQGRASELEEVLDLL